MRFPSASWAALFFASALASAALFSPQVACAQRDDASVDEARAVFSRGVEAYGAGAFEEALADFQRTYELTHDAQILYNVATVADRLRRDEVALEAYEGYLAGYPSAPDRANVEARIAALRAVVSARSPSEGDASEGDASETTGDAATGDTATGDAATGDARGAASARRESARRMGEGGLAFLITGGVLVLGGASLLIAAAVEIEAANRADTWAAFMGPFERVPILSAVGWISLGLGGALGALGVGWLVASSSDAESSIALRVGPMHLSLEGTF